MAPPPSSVSAGCLCGAIRFAVKFPPGTEWPLPNNTICHCTRCRKFSGSLLPLLISIPTAYIEPSFISNPLCKSYKTPGDDETGRRYFCSTCGSSLAWHDPIKTPAELELHAGCFDEEVLCGKRTGTKATEWGEWIERTGGVGADLCKTKGHIWLQNGIPGVTDDIGGSQWLLSTNQKPFEGSLTELEQKVRGQGDG